jgi:hypothetical protein
MMNVHKSARDSLRARGVRLRASVWKELEAVQLREGHSTVQDTVREAVKAYLAQQSVQRRSAA